MLAGLAPDVMAVVGYGQILPQPAIDIPPHASSTCMRRAAGISRRAPVQWAIANGATRTGVTTMRIDARSTGDMLMKAETEIGADERPGTRRAPAAMGARC